MDAKERNQATRRVFRKGSPATIRRYVGEVLLQQHPPGGPEEPTTPAEEQRYREMLIKNSRGRKHAK